jgi:hypothetical protein
MFCNQFLPILYSSGKSELFKNMAEKLISAAEGEEATRDNGDISLNYILAFTFR